MEIEGSFLCPYCLQLNTILVDATAGARQILIEDCQVCCHPARLTIEVDSEGGSAEIAAELP